MHCHAFVTHLANYVIFVQVLAPYPVLLDIFNFLGVSNFDLSIIKPGQHMPCERAINFTDLMETSHTTESKNPTTLIRNKFPVFARFLDIFNIFDLSIIKPGLYLFRQPP